MCNMGGVVHVGSCDCMMQQFVVIVFLLSLFCFLSKTNLLRPFSKIVGRTEIFVKNCGW
jgi:hypothetical protein